MKYLATPTLQSAAEADAVQTLSRRANPANLTERLDCVRFSAAFDPR